jgi:hypothetical protein
MKMDEWIGRYVQVKHRLETNRGGVLLQGDVLLVTGHWRGALSLARPDKPGTDVITKVSRSFDVELLPSGPDEIVKAAVSHALALAKRFGYAVTASMPNGHALIVSSLDVGKEDLVEGELANA